MSKFLAVFHEEVEVIGINTDCVVLTTYDYFRSLMVWYISDWLYCYIVILMKTLGGGIRYGRF